jgi:two-component system chemotaxis response regulator CheB
MPRVAFEIGAVERQLPLSRLSGAILDLCSAHPRNSVNAA